MHDSEDLINQDKKRWLISYFITRTRLERQLTKPGSSELDKSFKILFYTYHRNIINKIPKYKGKSWSLGFDFTQWLLDMDWIFYPISGHNYKSWLTTLFSFKLIFLCDSSFFLSDPDIVNDHHPDETSNISFVIFHF